jgi:hypothetical protein
VRFRKLLLLHILIFGTVGCTGIELNSTYYMTTTSFKYDPTYADYMLMMNGQEIGGGFGKVTSSNAIKTGYQKITWKDTKTGEVHTVKNEVVIKREQLRGKKYLALHIYPDDTIEIITSNNWPDPTEQGIKWREKIRNQNK